MHPSDYNIQEALLTMGRFFGEELVPAILKQGGPALDRSLEGGPHKNILNCPLAHHVIKLMQSLS